MPVGNLGAMSRVRLVGAQIALTACVLAGCALGPRPTLAETPPSTVATGTTGNDTLDAMLGQLAGAAGQTFTAAYAVTAQVGPVTTSATVTQQPPRTAVVMGAVTFYKGSSERTCTSTDSVCSAGIAEQKISDTGVTSNFYAVQAATQMRVSASRRNGDLRFSTQTVAATPADCVEIPIGTGVETYCVTSDAINVVARVVRADYTVELSSLSDVVTETVFTAFP
jgi:hypothetical protein